MTVVIDSGIWISALHFGGAPQAALDTVFTHDTIAICEQIVTEVRAILARKFSWTDDEVLSVLNDYTIDAIHADVTGSLHGICRDPKDDMVLECAVKSGAQLILTGDLDLLSLKSYNGISILTVRQFLNQR
ncbi:putative toxin-antitoxin system toxin component, PIN family [Terracidiphilus sp.]|uniref:putative toxin-antitoxin system toxin component, PIN family n=1 Tax=Terracidiphilus sp. TaxID=1964191 RepID=UPI003C1E17BF